MVHNNHRRIVLHSHFDESGQVSPTCVVKTGACGSVDFECCALGNSQVVRVGVAAVVRGVLIRGAVADNGNPRKHAAWNDNHPETAQFLLLVVTRDAANPHNSSSTTQTILIVLAKGSKGLIDTRPPWPLGTAVKDSRQYSRRSHQGRSVLPCRSIG
jgi:hypothetical protein